MNDRIPIKKRKQAKKMPKNPFILDLDLQKEFINDIKFYSDETI